MKPPRSAIALVMVGCAAAPALAQSTERVSVSTAKREAHGDSGAVDLSPDGRYVAFVSDADNLVTADHNGFRDVFLRIR